jgi:hypothetical protein
MWGRDKGREHSGSCRRCRNPRTSVVIRSVNYEVRLEIKRDESQMKWSIGGKVTHRFGGEVCQDCGHQKTKLKNGIDGCGLNRLDLIG